MRGEIKIVVFLERKHP